jgi:hypothetical protein
MHIAANAPAATASAFAAVARARVAYGAQPVQAAQPVPSVPARAEAAEAPQAVVAPGSIQTQVIVRANATARVQAATYDSRIVGASENVRSFDRIALVEKGFDHMRQMFEMANAKDHGALNKTV